MGSPSLNGQPLCSSPCPHDADSLPFMWALQIIAAMMHPHVSRLPIAPASHGRAQLCALGAWLQTMLYPPRRSNHTGYLVVSRELLLPTHHNVTDHFNPSRLRIAAISRLALLCDDLWCCQRIFYVTSTNHCAELPIEGIRCELTILFDGNSDCHPVGCWK
jgi:hypothetical protein